MANRFNFVNVGAAAGGAMREYLLEREMQRRQMVAEAEQAERLRLSQAADARAATTQADALKNTELNRQVVEGNLARANRQDVITRAGNVGVGGQLSPELAAELEKVAPEMLNRVPATFAQSAQTGEDAEGNPLYDAIETAPEQKTYVGDPKQRALAGIDFSKGVTPEQLSQLVQAGVIDGSALARIIDPNQSDTSWQRFNGTREGSKTSEMFMVNPKTREIKDSQGNTVTDKITPIEGGGEGMPFSFFPMQTGQGWQMARGNRQTGAIDTQRVGDLKPGEVAQRELENGILVNNLLGDISRAYTPEKVGIFTGRLKTLDQKAWGSDPEYAAFKQNLTTLANTIIQLRTGAQMSVQEAERIKAEIADENLPPSTFMARMGELQEQYREYVQIRAKLGFGRTTDDDIDTMMKTGGVDIKPGAVPGGPPSSAAPAPGAAPVSQETDEQKRARLRAKYLEGK